MIRHVAPGAVGALPIAPRAPTPWNSPSGRRPVVSAADPSPSARRVTAAMPTARRGAARPLGAGRFEPPTPVISAVPKGASTTEISDWTTSLNRGTTARTRLGLSEFGAVTRVRWAQPGPHPTSESALYAIRTPCRPPTPRPWTPALPMDAKSAPQGAWETAKNAVSHSAHSHLQDLHEKTAAGAERTGGCREFVSSSRLYDRSTSAPVNGGSGPARGLRPEARVARGHGGLLRPQPRRVAPRVPERPAELVDCRSRNPGYRPPALAPAEARVRGEQAEKRRVAVLARMRYCGRDGRRRFRLPCRHSREPISS